MNNSEPKPTPMPCICGRGDCREDTKSGRMISCPDPVKCSANLRTTWHSGEESAIVEWNGLVQAERHRRSHE